MMCFSAKEAPPGRHGIGGGTGGAILRAHTKKIFHKKSLEGKVPTNVVEKNNYVWNHGLCPLDMLCIYLLGACIHI
jgi:hypothetical protein